MTPLTRLRYCPDRVVAAFRILHKTNCSVPLVRRRGHAPALQGIRKQIAERENFHEIWQY